MGIRIPISTGSHRHLASPELADWAFACLLFVLTAFDVEPPALAGAAAAFCSPVPFRPDDGVHADGDDGDAYRRDSAADCGDSYCWSAPA